jgi:ABC-2 type transport system permease protein
MFFSCLGGPVSLIVAERERRTLRRLLISPLKPISYFIGIVFAYLIIAIGQAIIIYGISYLFGGRFHGSLVLGMLILLMSVFSFVGMGFYFGARFTKRTEDVNGPVAAFGVPLLVLGGTFFSVSMLPDYLLKLAYLNPIFHMNQALKGVSALNLGTGDILVHLIFLMAFTLFSMVIGARSYRAMLIREKRD